MHLLPRPMSRALWLATLLCVLALGAPAARADDAATAATVSAPDDAQRERFFASPEDPKPDKRERAAHYWAGNESFLYVFEPDVKDLRGGYMGVGSDQNYLFIGWQRPEFVWLTDYDDAIQVVHRIHRAFFLEADTPGLFIGLWSKADAGKKVLEETYASDPDYDEIVEVYDKSQAYVARRLRNVKKEFGEAGVDCYLTHQETYDFLVAMWKTERIRPMLGNLLDETALTGIGKAAAEMGVPIRVVYLSNAEQYWDYPDQFRTNFASLHFDEKSIIVRTIAMGDRADDYKYNVQPAANFNEWLAQSWITSVWNLKRDWTERHGREFSYSKLTVDEYKAKKAERDADDAKNDKAVKTQDKPQTKPSEKKKK